MSPPLFQPKKLNAPGLGWMLLAAISLWRPLPAAPAADLLADSFVAPPDTAKPSTWWYWGESVTTNHGITQDLESLKRVGFGGVVIYEQVFTDRPDALKSLSPEWFARLRFAAADAKLGQPEIRIGFIPPIATTQALVRLIGRPRSIRYLYDGRMVPAQEAMDWGLVDELVAPEALRPRVQAYGEELARKPPAALAAIRRTVTLGGGMTFDEGMALELETVAALADGPEFAEGVAAFLEKRSPVWRRP